ncbi:50S ribosomal protein L15e [Candidatus Woesearchaeota archaeon]|nr:50S ribosomal protein L15e [Candidatus Woesearchaeota archaeon]
MGLYKYIRNLWKKNKEVYSDYLVEWRREPSTLRIEKPTRIDRARELGYKAKQGIIVVRQRVIRGGHTRPQLHTKGGRRSKHNGMRLNLDKSYQIIAEERANKKFLNCEVLNSYFLAKDGKYYWYEVILADKSHPAIINDKDIGWISTPKQTGRAFRGLTSAGRRSRSLRRKTVNVVLSKR